LAPRFSVIKNVEEISMMRTIEVDVPMTEPNFRTASHLALEIAHANRMQDPMIVSWRNHQNHAMSPSFEGGNPDSWWEKYGKGNYGELEVSISHAYDFVLTDSKDFDTLEGMPLRDLKDSAGNQYLCYSSMLKGSDIPDEFACTQTDEWLAKQT
jgi:hypothetical protein